MNWLHNIFGHKYRIDHVDAVMYGVYDVRFECSCGAWRFVTVRPWALDQAEFWEGRARLCRRPLVNEAKGQE